jgi:homocysteine S-methyltransferase
MAALGLPYMLSFVLRRDGALLDGTPLDTAIDTLDNTLPRAPTGYAVNCVYPTLFDNGLAVLERQRPGLAKRILSYQANTSALDPKELDGSAELQTEEPEVLARLMVQSYRRYRTPFFGGCCGTDTRHIESLARAYEATLLKDTPRPPAPRPR